MTRHHHTGPRLLGALVSVGIGIFVIQAGTARAGSEKFDKLMQPILEQYLKIPKALSADKTDGVTTAAKEIEKLAARLDGSSVSGRHAKHFKDIPAKLVKAAKILGKSKDISTMRESLKQLSKPMAMWVTMSRPKGVSVAYCSMAPGSWLQRGTTIANPYYGAKMLRCGEIVAGEGAKKKEQPKH